MRLANERRDEAHALKCELAGDVLHSTGKLRIQVTGWSMLPAVWPGDTLLIDKAEGHEVSAGDIVLYGREQRFVAHRVVNVGTPRGREIVTRGDSMATPDRAVTADQLLGRVSFILRDGKRIQPGRRLKPSERVIAALVRNSRFAARVVVGVHGMRRKWSN